MKKNQSFESRSARTENFVSRPINWFKITLSVLVFGCFIFISLLAFGIGIIPIVDENTGIIILVLLLIGLVTFCLFSTALLVLVITVIMDFFAKNERNKKNKELTTYIKSKLVLYLGFGLMYAMIVFLLFKSVPPSHNDYSNNVPLQSGSIKTAINPITSESVQNAINEYRKQNNLGILEIHDPLCDLAKVRVYEIKTDWSHKGFESRSDDALYDRFCNEKNIQCTGLGENLAMDYSNLEDLMNGWINSPGHRENLLGNYNAQCVAVDDQYVTSMFGLVDKIEPSVVNNRNKTTSNNSNNVEYNIDTIKDWEGGRENDKKALNSWEDALNNDWNDPKETSKIIRGFNEKIDIANKVIDGITNSKITYQEYDDLINRYNDLSEEIQKTRRDVLDGAYDKCKESYDDLSEVTGKDYSDECKGYLE